MTNSDCIREIADKYGWNHSNRWFSDKLEKAPYYRYVTHQQIQTLGGRLCDRRKLEPEDRYYKLAKKFLQECRYDEALAKRLIRNVLHKKGVRHGY